MMVAIVTMIVTGFIGLRMVVFMPMV
jgi:hypothetical protein